MSETLLPLLRDKRDAISCGLAVLTAPPSDLACGHLLSYRANTVLRGRRQQMTHLCPVPLCPTQALLRLEVEGSEGCRALRLVEVNFTVLKNYLY